MRVWIPLLAAMALLVACAFAFLGGDDPRPAASSAAATLAPSKPVTPEPPDLVERPRASAPASREIAEPMPEQPRARPTSTETRRAPSVAAEPDAMVDAASAKRAQRAADAVLQLMRERRADAGE